MGVQAQSHPEGLGWFAHSCRAAWLWHPGYGWALKLPLYLHWDKTAAEACVNSTALQFVLEAHSENSEKSEIFTEWK